MGGAENHIRAGYLLLLGQHTRLMLCTMFANCTMRPATVFGALFGHGIAFGSIGPLLMGKMGTLYRIFPRKTRFRAGSWVSSSEVSASLLPSWVSGDLPALRFRLLLGEDFWEETLVSNDNSDKAVRTESVSSSLLISGPASAFSAKRA